MIYLISVLRVVLTAGVLFGFPALAVSAWRRGGSQRLTFATMGAFAVVIGYALLVASAPFGNTRVTTDGYARTATSALALFGVTYAVPLVAAALAVRMLGRDKLPFWAVYAATVGAAAFGWIIGMIGAIWVLS